MWVFSKWVEKIVHVENIKKLFTDNLTKLIVVGV